MQDLERFLCNLFQYNFCGHCGYFSARDGKDASEGTNSAVCTPVGQKSRRLRYTGGTELKCFGYIVPGGGSVDPPWLPGPPSGATQWLSLCSRTLGCSGEPGGSLLGVTIPHTDALVRQVGCAGREQAFGTRLPE